MRASLTDILARKIDPHVGQVGEDPRACPARGRSSHKVGEDVRVGVGTVECQLYRVIQKKTDKQIAILITILHTLPKEEVK